MYRILCIEDDAETRIILKKGLEAAEMLVDTVWSGEKGIEAAMKGAFDCIVLDLMMAGMDGFQVISTLKAQGMTAKLPIVVVTARADEQSMQRALAAGADQYIVKPFEINALIQTIRNLVDDRRAAEE